MPDLNPDPFDTRVLERNLRTGRLSREELQAHIDALPDDAAEGTETAIRMESSKKPAQKDEQQ